MHALTLKLIATIALPILLGPGTHADSATSTLKIQNGDVIIEHDYPGLYPLEDEGEVYFIDDTPKDMVGYPTTIYVDGATEAPRVRRRRYTKFPSPDRVGALTTTTTGTAAEGDGTISTSTSTSTITIMATTTTESASGTPLAVVPLPSIVRPGSFITSTVSATPTTSSTSSGSVSPRSPLMSHSLTPAPEPTPTYTLDDIEDPRSQSHAAVDGSKKEET